MKNWKNKKFVGSALFLVMIAFGVAQPQLLAGVGAEVVCVLAECE